MDMKKRRFSLETERQNYNKFSLLEYCYEVRTRKLKRAYIEKMRIFKNDTGIGRKVNSNENDWFLLSLERGEKCWCTYSQRMIVGKVKVEEYSDFVFPRNINIFSKENSDSKDLKEENMWLLERRLHNCVLRENSYIWAGNILNIETIIGL